MKIMREKNSYGLDLGMSLYLDLVRLLAALSVFFFHLGYGKLIGAPFGVLRVFGSNGVIVFFVLSGFVITHVLSTKEKSARSYIVARLSRLYSVVVPMLLLTIVLDTLGTKANPGLYPLGLTPDAFVADLFFVNSIWHHYYSFGSMQTFWSLGFEVWYYIAAGLFFLVPGTPRFFFAAAAILFAGPNIAELLPVWLLGAAIYRLKGRISANAALGVPLFVLPVIAFFVARSTGFFEPIVLGIGGDNGLQQLPVIYSSAVLFGAHLCGAQMLSPWLATAMMPIGAFIRWAAGASFTLYLAHLPLAFFIAAHDPWTVWDWRSKVLIVTGTLAGTLLIAEISERRKEWWRKIFERLLPAQRSGALPLQRTEQLSIPVQLKTVPSEVAPLD
jgi:peptidoglycan/LPS O-acetylase OafA/YrhL